KKKPCQVSITKVKKFAGSSVFVRRSQWSIDLLRQVNGIDPNRVSRALPYFTMCVCVCVSVCVCVCVCVCLCVRKGDRHGKKANRMLVKHGRGINKLLPVVPA